MSSSRSGLVELLNSLSSPDPTERWEAVEGLAQYRHTRVLRALEGVLLFDPDDVVRCTAAEQIGYQGKASALPVLVAGLADRSWLVRGWAAAAIGDLGVARYRTLNIEQIIEEALRVETHPFVKLNLWYALYRLGKTRYLQDILSLLSHRYYRFRSATANTLKDIIEEGTADKESICRAVEQAVQVEKTVAVRETLLQVMAQCKRSLD
ncbi:MAG: HEAT repeat domain-containing protein [Armatimonadota bacterium]